MPGTGGIVLTGSKSIAVALVGAIASVRAVITLDDRGDARSRFDELAMHCRSMGLEFLVAASRGEFADQVDRLRPDLLLVAGWYWLVPRRVLESTPLGVAAVHYSLLPKYRGGSPLVWSLINGEQVVGASLFRMTPRLDDGPIWAQTSIDVQPDDDIASLSDRLELRGVAMVTSTLPSILDGTLEPSQQVASEATYCLQRAPEDGRLDVTLDAGRIVRLIRAQTRPYPGAYVYRGSERISIWKGHEYLSPVDGLPGQIGRIRGELVMAAGDRSALVVDESEPELHPGDRLSRDPR